MQNTTSLPSYAALMRIELTPTPSLRCTAQAAQQAEARRLAGTSFGDVLIAAVGRVYEAQANIALGGLLEGAWAWVQLSHESLRWVSRQQGGAGESGTGHHAAACMIVGVCAHCICEAL